MTTLPYEKRGKKYPGNCKENKSQGGLLPAVCCSGDPARCSPDINNEESRAPEEPAHSGLASSLLCFMDLRLQCGTGLTGPQMSSCKMGMMVLIHGVARISQHQVHVK